MNYFPYPCIINDENIKNDSFERLNIILPNSFCPPQGSRGIKDSRGFVAGFKYEEGKLGAILIPLTISFSPFSLSFLPQ